jgi:hypothetical protein
MGAFFAVEIHGEAATVDHAENVVYIGDNGNIVNLDKMTEFLLEVARTEDGFEELSDEEIAERLLARAATPGEAEA